MSMGQRIILVTKSGACKSILSGQSMDVLEIDAASIVVSMRYVPFVKASNSCLVEGRKRCSSSTEANMLTTEAWNAFKTIESYRLTLCLSLLPQKLKIACYYRISLSSAIPLDALRLMISHSVYLCS